MYFVQRIIQVTNREFSQVLLYMLLIISIAVVTTILIFAIFVFLYTNYQIEGMRCSKVPEHALYSSSGPIHTYDEPIRTIPTRGYPNQFVQVGVLTREKKDNNDNQVIRLFGRQEYPGSNRYEYYTILDNQIQLPLGVPRKNELYDDDIVYIKELNSKYMVHLHNSYI
jgi:hypothetical protein